MKPRIVLYNPKSNPSGKKILPMSLLALGSVLEGHYEYSFVDGNATQEPLKLIREQIKQGANVVGVTVMPGPQLAEAFPHCRVVKDEFPEVTVVWGGYFPTLHASACLKSSVVDFVVHGYGELVFLELLNLLERGGDWRALPGLAYRDGSGAVVENPPASVPHPEDLPAYPYHRIDMPAYVRSTFLGSRTLPHHSSYGCPFLCSFCAVVNMANGYWLAQSAARLAKLAESYVERWQVNAIEFYDNNFFTQEARIAEFAERISPLGLSWWGEARIDTLLKYAESTWQSMRASGLKSVFVGAEAASAESLLALGKGGNLTPQKTLDFAAKAKQYGIVPELSFMVGSPPDPAADARAILEFIRQIKRVNPASEIIIYWYTPVPCPEQSRQAAAAHACSFPETLEEWVSPKWMEFACRRRAQGSGFEDHLSRKIRNFERVLNAYYPTVTDQRLTGFRRGLLRAAGSWRYHMRAYGFPIELRVLQRVLRYQRPETAGL